MSEPFGASWHRCDAGREGELIFRSENQSQLHECCKSLSEFVESTCTNTQANSELVTAEEDAGWKAWRCRYTSENAQKTSKDWAAKRRETAVLKYRETERGREIHIYIYITWRCYSRQRSYLESHDPELWQALATVLNWRCNKKRCAECTPRCVARVSLVNCIQVTLI